MKVEMIGTGAIYTKYNSASTLIDDTLLVDIPNGVHKQLFKKGYAIHNINHILITHLQWKNQ